LLAAFYGTMVVTLAGFVALTGTTRFLGARVQRGLVAVSVAVLAGLGVYLLVGSVLRLRAA
jgi:hypothetical protein